MNESGAASVQGNLEIEINNGEGASFYTQSIDVIYIPISRMLWRSTNSED